MQELPAFQQSYTDHNGAFEILAMGKADQVSGDAAFVEENDYSWVFGWSDEAPSTYSVKVFPTTFFIDASGTIKSKIAGGMDHVAFEAELAKIL